jgi:hypothetical protein
MKKILISLVLIFMATSVYGDAKTTYLICKGEFSELWHDKKKIYFDKNGGNAQITIQYRFDSDKKRLWVDTAHFFTLPNRVNYDDCLFSENAISCLSKVQRKFEMGKALFPDKPVSEVNRIMDRSYTVIEESQLSISRRTGDMNFTYSEVVDITEPAEKVSVDKKNTSARMLCEKSSQNKF